MQSTTEMTATETLIADAERHRRFLRRACWAGVAFVVAAILFAIANPLLVRWQLRQHGWILKEVISPITPRSWRLKWSDDWVGPIHWAYLQRSSPRVSDLELLRRFPNLDEIGLDSTDVSEPAFEALSQLSKLETLSFHSARLDADGIRHLATLPNLALMTFQRMNLDEPTLDGLGTCNQLRRLHLYHTNVSNESLRHLVRMRGLSTLRIHSSDLTDRGLEHIAHCNNVRDIDLQTTLITDAGIASLAQLSDLKSLTLESCRVTDTGAKQIADGCSGLMHLRIGSVPMTDAALREVARLPHLNYLELVDVPITDDGIRHLKSCSTLTTLMLQKTKVTSAGVTEMRKSLPTLEVSIE